MAARVTPSDASAGSFPYARAYAKEADDPSLRVTRPPRTDMTARTMAEAPDLTTLARLHAPKTTDELRVACVELHSRGFSDHDIAAATRLSVEAVRRLLGPT